MPEPLDAVAEQLAFLAGRARVAQARVNDRIHPQDPLAKDPRHYFAVGQSALTAVLRTMAATGRRDYGRILDFGAGWGRVARYLRAGFPESVLTVADPQAESVAFCAGQFLAQPWQVGDDPPTSGTGEPFDLIWCGSVMTRLPAAASIALLERFRAWLAPGGAIIVTTLGRRAVANQRAGRSRYLPDDAFEAVLGEYRRSGYGYAARDGVPGAGCAFVSGGWLLEYLQERADLTLVFQAEKAWDNHHDVFAVAKAPV